MKKQTRTERGIRRYGFSLIELLIVIGLIAALVAILLPAISRVRESSRAAISKNNLAQLGKAMKSYEGLSLGNVKPEGWQETLLAHADHARDILVDPSDDNGGDSYAMSNQVAKFALGDSDKIAIIEADQAVIHIRNENCDANPQILADVFPAARHLGMVNALMFGGHVRTFWPVDIDLADTTHEPLAIWWLAASEHNVVCGEIVLDDAEPPLDEQVEHQPDQHAEVEIDDHPDDHPDEHIDEHLDDQPADEHQGHPQDQPAEHPDDHPAEHPDDHPAEHPDDHPAEQPAQQPDGHQDEHPEDPANNPDEHPDEPVEQPPAQDPPPIVQPNPQPNPEPTPEPALGPDGFTKLEPATDTNKIYVSSSTGNDANPGTEQRPVKTLNQGHRLMRKGKPDWLLLKCGDVWIEDLIWDRGGRSPDERAVLTYYGDKSKGRPQIGSFNRVGGGGRTAVSNWAIVGIKLQYDSRNPALGANAPQSTENNVGINLFDNIENILIEDCYLRWWQDNITCQGYGKRMKNVVLRRNIILDSYDKTYRPQGFYASEVDGIVIEQNIFDHNGWANSELFGRTIFNHNIYLDAGNGQAIVRDNIIARGSSHGLQLRCGGVAENNVFWGNAINYFIGGKEHTRKYARGIRNLVLAGTHMLPLRSDQIESQPVDKWAYSRAWGIELKSSEDGLYEENMVLDVAVGDNQAAILLVEGNLQPTKTIVRNNIARNWRNPDSGKYMEGETTGFTLSGNREITGGATADDAAKAISTSTTMADWIDQARNRKLGEWDRGYQAKTMCDWMWDQLKDRPPR